MGIDSKCEFREKDSTITAIVPPRPGKKSLRSISHSRIKNAIKKKNAVNVSPIETCEAETRLIGDYLSDTLVASNRQAFEAHLNACPECVAFLATYKKTVALTRSFLSLSNNQPPKALALRLPYADRH